MITYVISSGSKYESYRVLNDKALGNFKYNLGVLDWTDCFQYETNIEEHFGRFIQVFSSVF